MARIEGYPGAVGSSEGDCLRLELALPEEQLTRVGAGRRDLADAPYKVEEREIDSALGGKRARGAGAQGQCDVEDSDNEGVSGLLKAGSLDLAESIYAEADAPVNLRDPQLRGPAIHTQSVLGPEGADAGLTARARAPHFACVAIFSCASARAAFRALTFLPSASPTTFLSACV